MKKILLLFFVGICLYANSQISGTITDKSNGLPLFGVKVIASDNNKILSDYQGKFTLPSKAFPIKIVFILLEYKTDTILIQKAGDYPIALGVNEKNEQTVVVSANKRAQKIEEIPISIEVIKPDLIDHKGITNLEEAVDQSPGVFTMDGQVSIRGGSGFAYGAGSRVLLLWNGMPLLSGYAGDTQWNAIPMEQAAQIEIMKGASSVLYGSGALNGVIALSEKEPGLIPETKIKTQVGIYDNPRRASLKWWGKNNPNQKFNPMNQQVEIYRSQMFNWMGYTISSTVFNNDGYREGESERRARISGTLYFRPKKIERIKAGIGYNYQIQKAGSFIIWQSDTLAYSPSGGADTSIAESTLTYGVGQRLFIDPYIKYIDKFNNRHNFKTRMYYAHNENLNNPSQSNGAVVYFSDYNFQRQFTNGINLISGVSNIYNVVKSNLFGDHNSNNIAFYSQFEHHYKKFDATAGMRIEHFIMDGKQGDSEFKLGKSTLPVYPIFRAGAHYELKKYTHLRASFGQGIRYPSVAERYTNTSVGSLNIFPNPNLRPEIGWAAEIGIKQGVKMGDWKGMIDLAGFINNYSNMIEFAFGLFNPVNGNTLNTATPEGLNEYLDLIAQGFTINNMIGFRAMNAEKARITGVELSFNSMGKIGEVELVSLVGYTYMNPISLNTDPSYTVFNSDSSRMLKYRFNHLIKADVEANWKNWSFGFSNRYSSYMKNIDKVFEDPIAGSTYILPGLKAYRLKNQKGNLVFDARVAYKFNESLRVSLIANNIFNEEYSSRPGDIQAPRNFNIQFQMKF